MGVTAAAVLVLTGCDDTAGDPTSNSSEDQPIVGSFEEATLVALGELFRIYGTDAAPAPLEASGEMDTHDGQQVWRLDGVYEITPSTTSDDSSSGHCGSAPMTTARSPSSTPMDPSDSRRSLAGIKVR